MVFIRKAINYKLYNMKILVTFNKIANIYKNLSSNIYRVVLLKTKIIGANNRMKNHKLCAPKLQVFHAFKILIIQDGITGEVICKYVRAHGTYILYGNVFQSARNNASPFRLGTHLGLFLLSERRHNGNTERENDDKKAFEKIKLQKIKKNKARHLTSPPHPFDGA